MCVSVILAVLVTTTVATDVVYESVEAKEGSNIKMICNLTPLYPLDKVSLVLWYRDSTNSLLYKYDARTLRPEYWSDPSSGNKYHLQMLTGERAELTVGPVTILDEDTYHCRVEFARSSSRITYVNLTVIGKYI